MHILFRWNVHFVKKLFTFERLIYRFPDKKLPDYLSTKCPSQKKKKINKRKKNKNKNSKTIVRSKYYGKIMGFRAVGTKKNKIYFSFDLKNR